MGYKRNKFVFLLASVTLFFITSVIIGGIKSFNDTVSANQYVKPKTSIQKVKYEYIKSSYKYLSDKYDSLQKQYEAVKNNMNYVQKNNSELLQDNIHLQNMIKMAASVGIKPTNYTEPPKVVSRGYYYNRYQGSFKVTAYTPTTSDCGNNLGITSSGSPIVAGYSVAVDNEYWPMGTVFYIKGIGYVKAMDTGGMIKGRNRMDLAFFDKKLTEEFGVRQMDVYLVKLGDGNVNKSQYIYKNYNK